MSRRRGRDGRPIPTVDMASEHLEVERRRYHQQIRQDLVDRGAIVETVKKALEEAAPRFREKGWRVMKEEKR
jgi:hypothetical protein